MDSYFMVDIKMNQDKEKQYREEFANWWIDSFCPEEDKIKSGDYLKKCILKDRLCDVEMSAYLAACKKRDEELEIERNLVKEYRDQCISNAEEIAQLKEQLKREAECVDYYSINSPVFQKVGNVLDGEFTTNDQLGFYVTDKRARSVQAQREVL